MKKNILTKESIILILVFIIITIIFPFTINIIFNNNKTITIFFNFIFFIILNTIYLLFNPKLGKGLFCFLLYNTIMILFPEILSIFNVFDSFSIRMTTYILILVLLVLMNKDILYKKIYNFKKNFNNYIKVGFKYWILGFLLMVNINIIINLFFYNNISINESANRTVINENIFLSFIIVVLLAPIIEEIVFRGSFKKAFKDENTYSIYTGMIFGLMHVLFNGDYLYAISYSTLGFFLGKMYYKTDNIYVPIIMHSLHNLLAFIIIIGG